MTTRDGCADRLAAFWRCTTAEEYLSVLDIAYDPRVVAVNRLHILRHFADQLADVDLDQLTAGKALAACRDALERSYRAFVTTSALDHRLFKVLQDRAPRVSIPLAAVALERRD